MTLTGEGNRIDPPAPVGSVYIDNTSYSGCDIKVVISLNDAGKGVQQQISDLNDQITKMEDDYDTVESQLEKAKQNTNTYRRGTVEFYTAAGRRNLLATRLTQLGDAIQAAMDRLKRLVQEAPVGFSKVLAEVQTLSASTYRDKQAVRACGSVYPRGFTRGPRQIAGSLVFTVFDQHVLYEFLEAHPSDFDAANYTSAVMDQLPPVDIVITFANEYGRLSRMNLYGVEFVSEGQTMSINDLITENVVNFVARDFDPQRAVGKRKIDQISNMLRQTMSMRASDLLFEEDYLDFKYAGDPFAGTSPGQRFRRRSNPFV